MDKLLLKGMRHLNYILAAICIIYGLASIKMCFSMNMWSHLIDGLLLLLAGGLLFWNALHIKEDDDAEK